MLFKYSGNKWKVLAKLSKPIPSCKRAVELYLGSGAFLLSREEPGLGIDSNPNIIDLWQWLKTVSEARLWELENIRIEAVQKAPDNKPDVRTLNLSAAEQLYMRVNVTGVYVGQLSSWKIYPKWKLPVLQSISHQKRLQNITLKLGKAHLDYIEEDGDIVFLDPPYIGTKGNYKQDGKKGIEEAYKTQDTIDLISRIKSPVVLTYGTDAPLVFPQYNWEVVLKKKVPNIRRGGSVERTEHVAFINWK